MLAHWINTTHLKTIDSKDFTNAKPFQHIILENFLTKPALRKLVKAVKKQNFIKKETDLYSFSQTQDLTKTIDTTIKEFHALLISTPFQRYLTALTAIRTNKIIDLSAFIYSNGDYLLCHDDCMQKRAIAFVLNLSENFRQKDGGELELLSSKNNKPIKTAKSIPPKNNTLVLFKVTKKSFHQVKEVITNKQRITIGGWFHES